MCYDWAAQIQPICLVLCQATSCFCPGAAGKFRLPGRQTTNDHQVTCIITTLPILGRYEMDPGKPALQDCRETAWFSCLGTDGASLPYCFSALRMTTGRGQEPVNPVYVYRTRIFCQKERLTGPLHQLYIIFNNISNSGNHDGLKWMCANTDYSLKIW